MHDLDTDKATVLHSTLTANEEHKSNKFAENGIRTGAQWLGHVYREKIVFDNPPESNLIYISNFHCLNSELLLEMIVYVNRGLSFYN